MYKELLRKDYHSGFTNVVELIQINYFSYNISPIILIIYWASFKSIVITNMLNNLTMYFFLKLD